MIFGGGQLWTLVADARGDVYHIDNNDPVDFPAVPTKSRYVARGIPYVALDWRWPFIAKASSGAFLSAGADRAVDRPALWRQSRGPAASRIADAFEFDDNNIFSFNQLPGYDLVESGPRANVGFIADALFPGGEVEGLLGQTYRLKPDPIFAAFSGETGTTSDMVGQRHAQVPASGLHRPDGFRPRQRHGPAA